MVLGFGCVPKHLESFKEYQGLGIAPSIPLLGFCWGPVWGPLAGILRGGPVILTHS